MDRRWGVEVKRVRLKHGQRGQPLCGGVNYEEVETCDAGAAISLRALAHRRLLATAHNYRMSKAQISGSFRVLALLLPFGGGQRGQPIARFMSELAMGTGFEGILLNCEKRESGPSVLSHLRAEQIGAYEMNQAMAPPALCRRGRSCCGQPHF
jgi:hypothetical protein